MHYPADSVFVTGVAKVGKDDAISATSQTFSLSLVIDIHSNRIISLSCNMVMHETVDFVCSLLVGKDIVKDVEVMSDIIRKRFLALAQKALIVALRDAQNHYLMAYPSARSNDEGKQA